MLTARFQSIFTLELLTAAVKVATAHNDKIKVLNVHVMDARGMLVSKDAKQEQRRCGSWVKAAKS